MFNNIPNQSIKYANKQLFDLSVDNKAPGFFEDVYCLICKGKKCVVCSSSQSLKKVSTTKKWQTPISHA